MRRQNQTENNTTVSVQRNFENSDSTRRNILKTGGAIFGASLLAGCMGNNGDIGTEENSENNPEDNPETAYDFDPIEPSPRALLQGYEAGDVTVESVVTTYLDRMEAYDDELDSVLTINPHVLDRARELDENLEEEGELTGSLHGIPVLVKDNIETEDMTTTAGAVAFEGFVPNEDATHIEMIREEGGIILGKANLDEFAFGYDGVSSIGGAVRNPYDTDRFAGGSSGGSGAATAANLTMLSIGTDTGGSVRVPAAACGLVGLRPTTGLVSREGIVPLALNDDTAGPMTRTVEGAALLLDTMVGYDPEDDITVKSVGETPHDYGESYVDYLDPDGLDDSGIGVVRAFVGPGTYGSDDEMPEDDELAEDIEEVTEIFNRALEEMEAEGGRIVDPIEPPESDRIFEVNTDTDAEYSRDKGNYLDGIEADGVPKSIEEIVESEDYSPGNCPTLENRAKVDGDATDEDLEYRFALSEEPALRQEVLKPMVENDLDALVFPTLINSPPTIDTDESWGANAQFTPPLDFPSITIPIGFTEATEMPVGMEIVTPRFEEETLFEIAYSYEQATNHREPPESYGQIENSNSEWSHDAIIEWNSEQTVEETVGVLGCDAPANPDE